MKRLLFLFTFLILFVASQVFAEEWEVIETPFVTIGSVPMDEEHVQIFDDIIVEFLDGAWETEKTFPDGDSYVQKLEGIKLVRIDALPNNVAHCSLDYLLQSSDIVTLHVPYSADNHYLINETTLARMKPNAILVNTSRGDLIQESALYQALKSKRLAGAALDVYSSEPYHGQLIELPNILLTAHMGGYAHEARNLMEQQAVDNLMKGLEIN